MDGGKKAGTRGQKPGHRDYMPWLGIQVLSCRKWIAIAECKQGNNVSKCAFQKDHTDGSGAGDRLGP